MAYLLVIKILLSFLPFAPITFVMLMMQLLPHIIYNQNFILSPKRCMFWEEQKALIVSDLHIGKTGHFRKYGIAVPQDVFKEDMQRLLDQITFFKAEQLLVVGDMFHSEANKELDLFLRWRNDVQALNIHLVKGNHDILKTDWYANANIQVHPEALTISKIHFLHDLATTNQQLATSNYIMSGHIHPGVLIKGISKQSLRFPCFYFATQHAVLPAFSRFTGLAAITPKKSDSVYAIVNQSIMKI
ncbi:ligase-associated DNA damage response endonuclease PdeM [Parasediminibacterium paludis]|uniref:Ligase-associated DNA damage response endonuclease PdeM n=1 Tax=Parasediminibacterium paludis TaxID=908966 RepID=A0ABV8PUS0_9BACT